MSDNNLLFLFMTFFILCTACKDDFKCSENNPNQFTYNSSTGKCQNCDGETGYNLFDLENIQRTKNAECVDLSNQVLITLVEGKTRDDLGYDSLYDFNFRGAKFDSAELFFNKIVSSDFRGADLRLLQYGYASIAGEIDKYTVLPDEGRCNEDKNQIMCHR